MYINHNLSVCADSPDILTHFQKTERMHFAYICVCIREHLPYFLYLLPGKKKNKLTNKTTKKTQTQTHKQTNQVLCTVLQKVYLLLAISLSAIYISIWRYKLIHCSLQLFPLPLFL